jgi:hypothetical protein
MLACLVLAAAGATARGGIIYNTEPNNTSATAQYIPISDFTKEFNSNIGTGGGGGFVNTSTTIPHVTVLRPGAEQPTANFDFFRFTTTRPGIIVADIDNAPTLANFDTVLHLFNSAGVLLATNDDEVGTGPGDGSGLLGGLLDSRIETGLLPAGDYIVAVAQSPSFGSFGANVTDPIPAFGSYTLNISAVGAVPAAVPVAVPEPGTMALLGVGVASLMAYAAVRRRKKA